jgi:hypothetical protein
VRRSAVAEKNDFGGVDPSLADLVREVQANTEAELRELRMLPSKFTRKTGMIDPDLDISPLRYEPKKKKEHG